VPALRHPDKLLAKRIELELSDPTQKYHIFVAPFPGDKKG
jgi:putative nucleotide binding protein